MQTFLPYPSFRHSLECLDTRRLGKQRVEAFQLIRSLSGEQAGWQHHPARRMWEGYELALKEYYNMSLRIWMERGYQNIKLDYLPVHTGSQFILPPWLGDEAFHASHRSNLLRKNPDHYAQFGWIEPPDLPYVWPR